VPWWPFNFGDNLSEQLVRIETKQDWIIKAFTDATASSGAIDMSKLHDHLVQLANELDSKADHVIANETSNETAFQDVITKLESTIEKLQRKLDDDASRAGLLEAGRGAVVNLLSKLQAGFLRSLPFGFCRLKLRCELIDFKLGVKLTPDGFIAGTLGQITRRCYWIRGLAIP
jgi:ribosome-associated translation inhibitor RaiA